MRAKLNAKSARLMRNFYTLKIFAFALSVAFSWQCFAAPKPTLLYSRYFNADGEDRYSADTSFKDVLDKMRQNFDVRVHAEPLNDHTLAKISVLLIANPSDKAVAGHPPPHHFTFSDVENIG